MKISEHKLNSSRPSKISETTKEIREQIFAILSEINPSTLDETINLKGK